jgi:hypothetical protein
MDDKQRYNWIIRGMLQEIIELIESDQKPILIPEMNNELAPEGSECHDFPELFIQIEGITEFKLPGNCYELKPSSILLLPPGTPHLEQTIGDSDHFMHMVAIFYPNEVEVHIATTNSDRKPTVVYEEKFRPQTPDLINRVIEQYVRHERTLGKYNYVFSKGLQLTLFGAILEHIRYGRDR